MAQKLLAADEPAAVTTYNESGSSPFLLVADHAGNIMPRALGRLGIDAAECERHIAWDIGIAGVGRRLADALDATLIQQNYSRLVIDCVSPARCWRCFRKNQASRSATKSRISSATRATTPSRCTANAAACRTS
jgi:predicted N-formylglutamate amidohydrolase